MKRIALLATMAVVFVVPGSPAPAEPGIPFCTPAQLNSPGSNPADVAAESQEATASDEILCRALPTKVSVGKPPLPEESRPGYHWAGVISYGPSPGFGFEGGQSTIQVVNIDNMPHDGVGSDFSANRLLMIRGDNPAQCDLFNINARWLEVGWAETDWWGTNAEQFHYTWSTHDCLWKAYGQANSGQSYIYRVRENNNNIRAERWNPNASAWILLENYDTPDCSPEQCWVENFSEFHASGGAMPQLPSPIIHSANKVQQDTTAWLNWTSAYSPGAPTNPVEYAPYRVCQVTQWTTFRVKDSAC